jgi:inosine-uridine nucleoside N-ribohydrolase
MATGNEGVHDVTKPAGIPLVMDVDTGTDDAVCIAAATLCSDAIELVGIGAVCGNVEIEKTARNTLDLVDFLGCDIPVHVGAAQPLARPLCTAVSHGATGLGDVVLPAARRNYAQGGVTELIRRAAERHRGTLEILAVGPLTNIATALSEHPELASMMKRITIMGGALRGGNMTLASEFNLYCDPEAARLVFESGCELTMVGLDVTLKPELPLSVFDRIRAAPGPQADVVGRVLDFMMRRKDEFGADDPNLHDVIALAAIVRPSLFKFETYYVHLETAGEVTRGMTVADFNNISKRPPNARVAVDIDVDGFWNWFVDLFGAAG